MPLHMCVLPRSGKIRLSPSLAIVEPYPVASATPGMRYYVYDGIVVEVLWWPDGRRCMRAVQSLASDHFRLLDVLGASDSPLLSASKITNWDTRLEVLGWLVDTEVLTVTTPPHKRLKLLLLLAQWPPNRTYVSANQVSQLAGVLMHIFSAVRPRSFFVHRLLSSVGMPRFAAVDHLAGRMANQERRVAIGPEFHADLEFWRWFVDNKDVDALSGVLSAPILAGAPGTTYVVLGHVKNRRRGILCRNLCLLAL